LFLFLSFSSKEKKTTFRRRSLHPGKSQATGIYCGLNRTSVDAVAERDPPQPLLLDIVLLCLQCPKNMESIISANDIIQVIYGFHYI
jgi:hypothetical protein